MYDVAFAKLSPNATDYKLSIAGETYGSAHDAMTLVAEVWPQQQKRAAQEWYNNASADGKPFSTFDRKNYFWRTNPNGRCQGDCIGAFGFSPFWIDCCSNVNVNGMLTVCEQNEMQDSSLIGQWATLPLTRIDAKTCAPAGVASTRMLIRPQESARTRRLMAQLANATAYDHACLPEMWPVIR